jgi:hypothetical protein
VTSVGITIALTHQGFGAIVLPFHKAIGEARGQKVKEGENFLAPMAKGRQGFAQFGGPVAFDSSYPSLPLLWLPKRSHTRCATLL